MELLAYGYQVVLGFGWLDVANLRHRVPDVACALDDVGLRRARRLGVTDTPDLAQRVPRREPVAASQHPPGDAPGPERVPVLALGFEGLPCRSGDRSRLLLLGVDRDHWQTGITKVTRLFVEVTELEVSIRVLRALCRLDVGLEAVARLAQHVAHRVRADRVPAPSQGKSLLAGALAGPAQRRHRIAAAVGLSVSSATHAASYPANEAPNPDDKYNRQYRRFEQEDPMTIQLASSLA